MHGPSDEFNRFDQIGGLNTGDAFVYPSFLAVFAYMTGLRSTQLGDGIMNASQPQLTFAVTLISECIPILVTAHLPFITKAEYIKGEKYSNEWSQISYLEN